MINERYMVSGVRVDTGEAISGYLWKGKGCYISNKICEMVQVDPATIEPVKVKPIRKVRQCGTSSLSTEIWYECPNCGEVVKGISVHCIMDYCASCGMALDWSE